MIDELREKLDSGEVSSEELFSSANQLAHDSQKDINAFVTIVDKYKCKSRKSTLITGIPYALKDNFSTKGRYTYEKESECRTIRRPDCGH